MEPKKKPVFVECDYDSIDFEDLPENEDEVEDEVRAEFENLWEEAGSLIDQPRYSDFKEETI